MHHSLLRSKVRNKHCHLVAKFLLYRTGFRDHFSRAKVGLNLEKLGGSFSEGALLISTASRAV